MTDLRTLESRAEQIDKSITDHTAKIADLNKKLSDLIVTKARETLKLQNKQRDDLATFQGRQKQEFDNFIKKNENDEDRYKQEIEEYNKKITEFRRLQVANDNSIEQARIAETKKAA